ncbi:hypothetical protein [Fimbriimonas ginsengisoli]|uniref:Uncharacterized protein n=1 Tax=Fimbriimonas ginsengisoli Gsoil 348 TaxID=661478 RepID=A0A068NJ85_FIMGI|nr:hypothetical protein [Fimbriimonas ginsengisoli]AIE83541.1 hypothetical protein OP10G_0173 [Fimbriimonas ginsengisoli Gsoil 348]
MPINGTLLPATINALEFACHSSGTPSGSGPGQPTYSHQATHDTFFAPNAIDLSLGLYLHAESSYDGSAGTWQAVYDGPGAPFGGYVLSGSGFQSSVKIAARPKSVKLYGTSGGLTYISWSEIEIWLNDALNITLPSSGIASLGNGCGPNYTLMIGIPSYLTGSAGAGRIGVVYPAYDNCDPGHGLPISWSTSIGSTAAGGWRFQEIDGGAWTDLPVALYHATPPAGGDCPFGLGLGTVSGGSTSAGSIDTSSSVSSDREYVTRELLTGVSTATCYDNDEAGTVLGTVTTHPRVTFRDPCTGEIVDAYRDVYSTESWSEHAGGSVWLYPNLATAIRRFSPGYRCAWYRGTLPETTASASRSCTSGGVTVTTNSSTVVHPAVSYIASVVGSGAHPIEDVFTYTAYSPTTESRSKHHSKTFDFAGPEDVTCDPQADIDCPTGNKGFSCGATAPDHPEINDSETVSGRFPATVGPIPGNYQWHYVDVARYLATWPNRLWQFANWREDWKVDGSPVAWPLYWGLNGEQWLYNPAFPVSEQRRTRNSQLTSCLEQSGYTPFLDAFFGGLRWIGVSRWQTMGIDPPDHLDLTAAGADAWTIEHATPTYTSTGITLDSPDATTLILTLDTTRWDVPPHLYPAICDRIRLSWSLGNVAQVRVYCVAEDGSLALLEQTHGDGFTTSGVTYRIPAIPQSKSAGSWAIDNGDGVVTDTGTDVGGSGISPATMADPIRAFRFGLLGGRTVKALRFEVDLVSMSTGAVVNYPRWIYAGAHPTPINESRQIVDLIWPNGPGVRLGNHEWWDGSTLLSVPNCLGLGYTTTVIDALCAKREIFFGVDRMATYPGGVDLTTELVQRYDAFEGESVGQVDQNSLAFLLPKGTGETMRWAIVNTMSELPPFACWPRKRRDPLTWAETGSYCLEVWDMAQEDRFIVSEAQTELYSDTGVRFTSPWPAPAGWAITRFAPKLDNTETGWQVRRGGTVLAHVRPWHGWFCLKGVPGDRAPWHYQHNDGSVYQCSVDRDGNLWARYARHWWPNGGWINEQNVTTTGDVDDGCIWASRLISRAEVAFSREITPTRYDLYTSYSKDRAKSWTEPVLLMSNARYPRGFPSQDGGEILAWIVFDSGASGPATVYGRYRGRGGSWSAPAPFKDASGADIRVSDATGWGNPAGSYTAHRALSLHLVIEGEVSASWWECTKPSTLKFRRIL